MSTRPQQPIPGITAESYVLRGWVPVVSSPPTPTLGWHERPMFIVRLNTCGTSDVLDAVPQLRYSVPMTDEYWAEAWQESDEVWHYSATLFEHLDSTYDFVTYFGHGDTTASASLTFDLIQTIASEGLDTAALATGRDETAFMDAVLRAGQLNRPAPPQPSAPFAPNGLDDVTVIDFLGSPWRSYNAASFRRRLQLVWYGFEFLRTRDHQQPQPQDSPGHFCGPETEPLAVACGITRMTVPITPGAPPSAATSRSTQPAAMARVAVLSVQAGSERVDSPHCSGLSRLALAV
ncbi:hypothetical protein [Kitasatospora sp. NPDC057223]|uniref:hypothetical protein n=1 Tax=Kitasatospora sp. NPDC057223 TaxID=3346055 RepID=UPI003625D567